MIVRMFSPRQLQIVEKKVKSERKREYEMTRNVQTKTDAKLISTYQRRFSLTSLLSCRANERDVLLLARWREQK